MTSSSLLLLRPRYYSGQVQKKSRAVTNTGSRITIPPKSWQVRSGTVVQDFKRTLLLQRKSVETALAGEGTSCLRLMIQYSKEDTKSASPGRLHAEDETHCSEHGCKRKHALLSTALSRAWALTKACSAVYSQC
jgi:hypothetical protein